MPEINYNPLKGRIKECGYSQQDVATLIGISSSQLNRKLAGEFCFRQDEISKLCDLLHIKPSQIGRYFFTANS